MTASEKPFLKSALLVLAAVLTCTTGCASRSSVHGDPIDDVRLSSIVKGTHTRGDVAALFGSPSSSSPFTDGTWYYISARKEGFAFIADAEVERQIVAVRFDERGVVNDIQILTLENGRVVDVVSRETPSFGEDLSILQQFLGNVGRFEKDTTQQRR